MSVGYINARAVTTRKAVLCRGDDSAHQLGNGTLTDSLTPVKASVF